MCNLQVAVYNKTAPPKRTCSKCGIEYIPTQKTTLEYCTKCHSAITDSYNDLINCFEDQDLRDLKPYEHH